MSENGRTGWWMMQSAANHSPRSSSLLNRELTGNFGVFGPKMSPGEVEKSRFYKGFSANSLLNGTGNFKPRTGNFFGGTGNFRGGAELYRSRIFAVERSSSRRKKSALSAN